MLIDFILVIAGIVVFMIPAILQKERRSRLKTDFTSQLSRLSILSGIFVSLCKLLLLMSNLESQLTDKNRTTEGIEFSAFLIMIFVRFRPALMGILVKVILLPFSKKHSNKTIIDSATTPASQKSEQNPFTPLSPREKEVARLAARGYSNAQIAEELFISVETVKRHMSTIFEKLEIKSRKELIEKPTAR
ncbi:MAG: hypothetical protein J5527_11875 [Treponema sp.]|nr:hypothetical protein [Treponema sp.]